MDNPKNNVVRLDAPLVEFRLENLAQNNQHARGNADTKFRALEGLIAKGASNMETLQDQHEQLRAELMSWKSEVLGIARFGVWSLASLLGIAGVIAVWLQIH